MLKQILVPSKENSTISIPAEFYGIEVEVVVSPVYSVPDDTNRKIGILEGKASFSEQGNGKITEEEFLGL